MKLFGDIIDRSVWPFSSWVPSCMTESVLFLQRRRSIAQASPFYYGWVNVVVASVAMTATLPGRTHGLGLITEPLLRDLNIDRILFARINLVASLLGAAFCIPVGWLIDRHGIRAVLATVTLALGVSVVGMSSAQGPASLLVGLILVRGFGQSALSVVSMAVIGKWFRRRLGTAMGVFAVLLTFGFIASVLAMGSAVERWGWQEAWQGLGFCILTLAPLFWLLARSTPESCGLRPDEAQQTASPTSLDVPPADGAVDFTVRQALATPAFWVVVLGGSAFNLMWSGVTLFNESMLAERGLGQEFAVQIMAILTGIGLVANLIGGALATRTRVVKLLGVGLFFLAVGLALFPSITGPTGARLYAIAIGLSGGIVTVVFFAACGHLFGRTHLGRIQGGAQLATVLASALGPVVMAESLSFSGSYTPAFYGLAGLVGILALAALLTPTPNLSTAMPALNRGN
jgi:MFS transporter, OFA family, oxalate/formate antiporter